MPNKTPSTITYLTTSFQEREQVKSLGAKWDAEAKKWYVSAGIDITPFNMCYQSVNRGELEIIAFMFQSSAHEIQTATRH